MSTPTPYRRVKVFGERGSGTNFLNRLIYANFEAEMLVAKAPVSYPEVKLLEGVVIRESAPGAAGERVADYLHDLTVPSLGGWKHACLTDQNLARFEGVDETLIICIVRHPALWIRSFHKQPYCDFFEEHDDLDKFVRTPWITRSRDELPDLVLEGPALLWRLKLESYLRQVAKRPNVRILRHEDLLTSLNQVLDLLAPHLVRRRETWGVPKGHGRTWEEETRDYWNIREELPEDPWSTLSAETAELLRQQIGAQLLDRFGYG